MIHAIIILSSHLRQGPIWGEEISYGAVSAVPSLNFPGNMRL